MGVSPTWWCQLAAAASVVAVTSLLAFPFEVAPAGREAGAALDSSVLLGLAAAAGFVASTVLLERSPHLLATAARGLHGHRSAAVVVAVVASGAAASPALVLLRGGVSPVRSLALAGAFTGAGLLGAVVLGAPRAWMAPLALFVLFSTPRLVPLEANVLYGTALVPHLVVLAAVLVGLGAAAYCWRGPAAAGD